MKASKLMRIGLLVLGAGILAGSYAAEGPRAKQVAMKTFMRQKLLFSQGILEGLALEKFDLVSKNAIRMRDMTQSNHWTLTKQPDYRAYTTNFQENLKTLYLAAIDRKLDEATAAYMKMAHNCVDCHRLTRMDQR